ncbi:MAG: hypothetical protein A2V70_12645 [Planctomycetes bacterium RBG_13_63_9]|nr:MAG: hypothetical protein A2V70_12645 [Planctomycetes bacterium RBG_13_63_9]
MTTPTNVSTDVLRTLHRIHRQLSDLRGRLERGPQRVRASEAYVQHQEDWLAELQADARAIRMAADKKQLQLKEGEDKVKDLKLKLNMAASNREYQALRDQIAAQEMTNSILADEILEGLEKVDDFRKKTVDAEANVAAAREKNEKVCYEVSQREPLIRGDLARLELELRQCEVSLPTDVRVLYDRVVRHRGEDAMASVENEHCSGCHQHVPLNVVADIMLAHPMFCKSCGRLLYMLEDS